MGDWEVGSGAVFAARCGLGCLSAAGRFVEALQVSTLGGLDSRDSPASACSENLHPKSGGGFGSGKL